MNLNNQIASSRRYKFLISEDGQSDVHGVTLNTLLNISNNNENNYEYLYAAYDIIDEILDLKNGESLYFHPNRDNKNSKGIITRNDK